MHRRLRAVKGPLLDSIYALGFRTIIGRGGDTDVQVLDKGVSRQHAAIVENDDGQLVLMDLSSRNGTFVFEERVMRHPLSAGDTFRIGDTTFVFELTPEETGSESIDDLRLLSGPAEEPTFLGDLGDAPVTPRCKSDMHAKATMLKWKFCPACGEPV